jgi:hypothetical protein
MNRHWAVIHLRSRTDPRMTCCGLLPATALITDNWGMFTCGACLVPWRQSWLDPRS